MSQSPQDSRRAENESTPDTATENRRRAERMEFAAGVRLRVDACQVEGKADNLSAVGLLFTSATPLRVVVELEAPEGTLALRGRLIRVASFGPHEHGFAVEFDADERAKVRDLAQS
jgi:hypothetical protein